MYSTCVFCTQSLGSNEILETFPVGRRLAFDPAKGRLWVVCRKCERWNLSPIEERWEAIEDCERFFRDTRTRVSTENIGLARLAEGLELVRVGVPLRPEFAAWRYGDQFGRRRRRTILYTAGAATAFGALVIGGALTGAVSAGILAQSGNWINMWVNGRTLVRLRTDDGRLIRLRNPDIQATRLIPADNGRFDIAVGRGKKQEVFTGEEAERVANRVVPRLNAMGGNPATVQDAVREIERHGGPEAFLQSAITEIPVVPAWQRRRAARGLGTVANLSRPQRLAIEMALHEENERRALMGELQILEEAWKAAEEIAGIADDLILPAGARSFIEKERESRPES